MSTRDKRALASVDLLSLDVEAFCDMASWVQKESQRNGPVTFASLRWDTLLCVLCIL